MWFGKLIPTDFSIKEEGAVFERVAPSPPNLAPAMRERHLDTATNFKHIYLVDLVARNRIE